MMLQKLLANKKNITLVIALLLALCVGILILVTPNDKEADGKNVGTKTEQSKDNVESIDEQDKTDTDDKTDGREDNQNNGLEVVEPGVKIPENFSDASGDWGETTESGTQIGGETPSVKPEETPSDDKQENLEIEDAKDDKIWSEIY